MGRMSVAVPPKLLLMIITALPAQLTLNNFSLQLWSDFQQTLAYGFPPNSHSLKAYVCLLVSVIVFVFAITII